MEMGRKDAGIDIRVLASRERPGPSRDGQIMFVWLTDWRERQRRICADADDLVRLYGIRAYEEAFNRARGLGDRKKYWDCVRREIGQREFAIAARNLI